MLKIRALNRESSSDEDVPAIRREAQEEIALELYNKALRLQSQEQYDESKSILQQLLDENIPLLENNGGLPKSMQTLKYSCYLNIGNMCLKLNSITEALETYLLAVELDDSDVTLWYKIGKLSLQEKQFRQSAYAFAKGLDCVESHWPCLDQLISLLYATQDTISCLIYIGKALILNPNYLKGLVLRRQIYLDNPATEEYYKLYNPDYIYEPSLDVSLDEEEVELLLKEAKILCEKVTEVEKSFGPKPLQTIPLPKPLEEYTWLSAAQTVIHIHKYIADNGLSYLTFIDMKNCMSQHSEKSRSNDVEMVAQESIVEENIPEAEKTDEEKMQVEPVVGPERRLSQNNEGVEELDNTPVQTDNDEEQNADQENDEPDENPENKPKPKNLKRKRDLLSDLQIWGWHSKRKQSKKAKEKDFTVEDAINRIIPANLLLNKIEHVTSTYSQREDSMNTMDIYNMYVEEKNLSFLSPIHSPVSVNYEPYFGTNVEKDDVLDFWSRERECVNSMILVKELVFSLSKLWQYKWPKELVPLYIEAYNLYREHYDPPQLFCQDHPFEIIKDNAIAMILYAELLIFSSDLKQPMQVTILGYLQIVSGWDTEWQEEYVSFSNRVYWLLSHLFQMQHSNDLALRALGVIQENIEKEETTNKQPYLLNLPNCFKCGLITKQIVENFLKHLDLIDKLGAVVELYNNEKYREVAETVKLTFKLNSRRHFQVGRLGRPAQIGLLLDSLWYIDLVECFVWTEECLYEALHHFLKPANGAWKWEKIVEKCLAILYEIIKTEGVVVIDSLTEEKTARLVETLAKIACKQINSDSVRIPLDRTTPWILIHYVLERNELKQYVNRRTRQGKKEDMKHEKSEDELYPSVAILFSAHEFLGPKGWCLTREGEFLHFILDRILDRLDTPIFDGMRDKIDIHIEQSLFCLYQHPSKKNKISRHLADHNVDPLPLTWERSFQLYEFYGPTSLPEFNSYKNASISTDLEQLFKRIIALVPTTCAPQQHLPKIMDFIHGKTDEFPDAIDFPYKVRPIYYLIGDFYFKQREFNRCIKYFQMDLCINPLRLDSWACLALSYAAQLDSKLNHCEKFKSDSEFLDKSKYASICFEKALELSWDPLVLWIEFGTFQYMVHSYCSRMLKHESENFSIEKFEYMESQKNTYLENSRKSFEEAIALYSKEETPDQDERWLQYYILGKIAEKKQKEPAEYLQHYTKASQLLDESNAQYPIKINYSNPQQLSVEALELHYRIHASILKYLELNEGKNIPNSLGELFNKCISSSPFLKKLKEKKEESAGPEFLEQLQKISENDTVVVVDDNKQNEDKKIVPEKLEEGEKPMETDKEAPVEKPKVAEVQDTIETVISISDSDDEQNKLQPSDQPNQNSNPEHPKQDLPVKDVQKVLDEMMVQTMKETEQQQNELDSDLSTTEKIEVVVVKDDSKTSKELKKEKEKPIKGGDSESDAEIIRPAVEKANSSSNSSESSSESTDSESDDDENDSSSSSSDSSSEDDNENMSSNEISQLIDKCVSGLEICIVRLTQNYKALYRLAHLYFNYKSKRDLVKCKQLLLGEYKCKDGSGVSGLFSDRKLNNFFNGIWRIPSSEIDRPGSLSAHIGRCINLLMNVLTTTNDTKTLIDLCLNLRKTPEPDKIYIKDSDRMVSSEQALTLCTQCLRSQIRNVSNMTNPQIVKLLQEIHRVYQRLQKHLPGKESQFGGMLAEVYRKFIKEKIPDNVNVLDLAVKFCMQHKAAERPKVQQVVPVVTPTPLPRTPGILTPPVLPAPSTITPPKAQPRRPGSGRPRGRPPLPRLPGHVHQPRTKSPNVADLAKPYNWPKPVYQYIKHYQDELIKQYSQNLSLPQLTQLSQMMTQGQLRNPVNAAAITNHLLAQAGLLNPGAQLKQPSPATSLGQPPSSHFMDTLRQMGNVKKKVEGEQAAGSFMNSMRQLNPSVKKKVESEQAASSSTAPLSKAGKSQVGKTLQEKLADKKKEQLNKQLKGINANVNVLPSVALPKSVPTSTSTSRKFAHIPKVPTSSFKVPNDVRTPGFSASSFYIPEKKHTTKIPTKITFPAESGISIGQVSISKGMKTFPNLPSSVSLSKVVAPSTSVQLKDKTTVKLPPEINITKCEPKTKVFKPNVPQEKTRKLSTEENVISSDDDVICIN